MRIVSVVGARPQFIKAAVLRRIFAENDIEERLIHTGQHYDNEMSGNLFLELEIKPPDYTFSLTERSHGAMTGEILKNIESVLLVEKPDYCLVYGDTNSTLAGALAASKLQIPVIHVEAGLRSRNLKMPEEINRILTDHASSILFCSTNEAVSNLSGEGITKDVYWVGDIMYDVLLHMKEKIGNREAIDKIIDIGRRPYALLTLHRQENLSDESRLRELVDYVKKFAVDYEIILLAHPNTKRILDSFHLDLDPIYILPPQGYTVTQTLVKNSAFVLTDSGGLQKEAYFNGVRCVTLRDETEWNELITNGWNRLWTDATYRCDPRPIPEYGSGDTGRLILNEIQRHYALNTTTL